MPSVSLPQPPCAALPLTPTPRPPTYTFPTRLKICAFLGIAVFQRRASCAAFHSSYTSRQGRYLLGPWAVQQPCRLNEAEAASTHDVTHKLAHQVHPSPLSFTAAKAQPAPGWGSSLPAAASQPWPQMTPQKIRLSWASSPLAFQPARQLAVGSGQALEQRVAPHPLSRQHRHQHHGKHLHHRGSFQLQVQGLTRWLSCFQLPGQRMQP